MSPSRVITLVIISITLSILASQLFFKPQLDITTTLPNDIAIPTVDKNQPSAKPGISVKQVSDDSLNIADVESGNNSNQYFELLDETQIDALFVNQTGAIERKALVNVLTSGMNDFIEQVSNLPISSEFAIERQHKLNQQLLDIKNMTIYEQYAVCAGRICALSITTNELTEANKQLIENFDSNHSFVNTSESATGELDFKGIYIYTDDPSQMAMTRF
ncbi:MULTISPECIES: hypothetical protein [unclassified Shewanella]|uniref:hypothetical protein n=1 Tax=unclassified Shewanella TaxID=196818 RepID=UPI001BC0824C|nr:MULTISPECIES: hypothetical protein [unclassified Shewanella]GIU17448.1 hypothetical protein TUM4444_31310 [Shewanella sp. MBTL60-112-B1]GIU36508.1 hypothetical protein TUM4445_27690 [Shewanella sp. MBTL60-112-B2]